MKHLNYLTTLVLLLFSGISLQAQTQDPLQKILKDELNYQFAEMKKQPNNAYFMDFRVIDRTSHTIQTDFGAVSGEYKSHVRNFVPSIRVGNSALDNQFEPHQTSLTQGGVMSISLPLKDDANAIKQVIWEECFNKYKRAVSDYERIVANQKLRVENEDQTPSLNKPAVETFYEAPLTAEQTAFDTKLWSERMKKVSAEFQKNPDLMSGSATIAFEYQRRYYISTEGTDVVQNSTYVRISINAMLKADDGMDLPLYQSYFAFSPDGLPTEEQMLADVKILMDKLVLLKNAPLAGPYTGPALLSGEASGVFFHEIFGHRIEAQRMKSDADGQTFKKLVGQNVLPSGLNVYSDPTLKTYIGEDLNGYYKFDDQGVKAQRVEVVKDGKLYNFLMTRTPIDGFEKSNG
ncbi:MAG: TldD/PmbA family protein, partial [Bacteroidales bacterium]|nr:TldD/PmbA family protein [Bacteroidales bacterium]